MITQLTGNKLQCWSFLQDQLSRLSRWSQSSPAWQVLSVSSLITLFQFHSSGRRLYTFPAAFWVHCSLFQLSQGGSRDTLPTGRPRQKTNNHWHWYKHIQTVQSSQSQRVLPNVYWLVGSSSVSRPHTQSLIFMVFTVFLHLLIFCCCCCCNNVNFLVWESIKLILFCN